MKYFVTGASGFLGDAICRRLRDAGHEVHALVRSAARGGPLEALGARIFVGDVTDKESMRPPMQGVDGLFHVAGWYKIGTRDKRDGERVNVQGTRHVLEVMKELGIAKGVYTSSLAVNSDTRGKLVNESYRYTGAHLSEYDRTKAAAHEIARDFIADGLPLVIVMPGLVYGPGDTSSLRASLLQLLEGRLPAVPSRTAVTWAHIDDVAEAHILAMSKGVPGETYMICGEPFELAAAFEMAAELAGVRPPTRISPNLVRLAARLVAPFERFLPLPAEYTAEGLRVVAGVTYLGDNSRARRELGYAPRPLREGLKATLEHERALLGMK